VNYALLVNRTFDSEIISAAVYKLVKKLETIPQVLNTWNNRQRGRKQLANLPNYLLKDIGLNRHDVENEINKPFWR